MPAWSGVKVKLPAVVCNSSLTAHCTRLLSAAAPPSVTLALMVKLSPRVMVVSPLSSVRPTRASLKMADTSMSPVTCSTRVALVWPSLHRSNTKPSAGTAVTRMVSPSATWKFSELTPLWSP